MKDKLLNFHNLLSKIEKKYDECSTGYSKDIDDDWTQGFREGVDLIINILEKEFKR